MLECPECECTEMTRIVYRLPRPDDSGTWMAGRHSWTAVPILTFRCGSAARANTGGASWKRNAQNAGAKAWPNSSTTHVTVWVGWFLATQDIKNAADLSHAPDSRHPDAGSDTREGRCCIPPGIPSWECNECHVTWGLLRQKCPKCTSNMVAEMRHDHAETAARNDGVHAWGCGACGHGWGGLEKGMPCLQEPRRGKGSAG